MAGPTRIRLRSVSKRYRVGSGEVSALEDVDLTIDDAEFVVILGPSGSGKTTLLNVIGALDTPTSGSIEIDGFDLSNATARQRAAFRRQSVSFVFQSFNLFPGLTAVENVRFGAEVAGRDDPPGMAVAALSVVGLDDRLDHFPHQLSGGEQQRVAIARALATGNPVLLADEPTGELDFRTGVQILTELESQARAGRCVLVVTHNREIARVGDRVVELSSGHVTADGPPPGGRVPVSAVQW